VAAHADVKRNLDFIVASKEKLWIACDQELTRRATRQTNLAAAQQMAQKQREQALKRMEEADTPPVPVDGARSAAHFWRTWASPSDRRQAGSKGVILNMATEAETTVKRFHSPDRDVALKPDGGFRKAKTLPRDNNLALQALTGFERLAGDAIEAFTAEILGGAFNRRSFNLAEQTHRPMQCYPRAVATITRYGHGATLANPLRDGRDCSLLRSIEQFPYGITQDLQAKRFLKKGKLARHALIVSQFR